MLPLATHNLIFPFKWLVFTTVSLKPIFFHNSALCQHRADFVPFMLLEQVGWGGRAGKTER